jgi:hypothetical protein
MGLKRGYCKETVQIVGILRRSSEESVWMKEGSDPVTMLHYLWRDGSVGIATHTGWTVRLWNPSGGRDFPHPYRPAVGPTQPTVKWVMGLLPLGNVTGVWPCPPTHI